MNKRSRKKHLRVRQISLRRWQEDIMARRDVSFV